MFKIESLVRQYGDDLVMDKLNQVTQRVQNSTMSPIGDNHAYLRSILANVSAKKTQDFEQPKNKQVSNTVSTVEFSLQTPSVKTEESKLQRFHILKVTKNNNMKLRKPMI